MNEGSATDPNIFFATYAGLILILLVAAIYLNPDLEPEVVLQIRARDKIRAKKMEETPVPDDRELGLEVVSQRSSGYVERTLCASCSFTFRELCRLFQNKEFSYPIAFFWLQGLLMPNLDDLHYVFLTQTLGMQVYSYDFLNSITYVSLVLLTISFNRYLRWRQVWLLILCSLLIFMVLTSLMLVNATRANLEWGLSDHTLNCFIFFIAT